MKTGHKTRLFCSGNEDRKAKPHLSKNPKAQRRDNVGQQCFPCKSRLIVTCRELSIGQRLVRVYYRHVQPHRHYYNVEMPPAALAIIRENLEYSKPNELVTRIQALWDQVSTEQVYSAWARMSETIWKRDKDQLTSARILLKEFPSEVDLFEDVVPPEGVEQLCFGMKRILHGLKGKIVEIEADATCKKAQKKTQKTDLSNS